MSYSISINTIWPLCQPSRGTMGKAKTINPKFEILKAIFAEAKRQGIPQETVREDIAPGVIGKRLSQARPQEAARVLDHIRTLAAPPPQSPSKGGQLSPRSTELTPKSGGGSRGWKYTSSRAGLLEEVKDIAIARFGQDYIVPLNNLCARFGEGDGYHKMRVSALKELKRRLKELNQSDPWEVNHK